MNFNEIEIFMSLLRSIFKNEDYFLMQLYYLDQYDLIFVHNHHIFTFFVFLIWHGSIYYYYYSIKYNVVKNPQNEAKAEKKSFWVVMILYAIVSHIIISN